METHQSMDQQRESVLPSKPQLLRQNLLEEERVHRPHLCNDRLEDIVQESEQAFGAPGHLLANRRSLPWRVPHDASHRTTNGVKRLQCNWQWNLTSAAAGIHLKCLSSSCRQPHREP